jgi:hypothetical protein
VNVPPRLPVALAVAGLVLISALTGIGGAGFTGIVTAVLRLAGAPAVTRLGPTLFAVGAERYLVTFWCTPATLVLCLLFLLAFAGQRPRAYLLTVLAFAAGATALFVANIGVSVYLHQAWGIAWPLAHNPSLAAAYVLGLGAGLAFVRSR